MVVSMQGLGLVLAPLLTNIHSASISATTLSATYAWHRCTSSIRNLDLRSQIAETPRFALAMNGDLNAATQTIGQVTGTQNKEPGKTAVQTTKSKQKTTQKKKSWLYLLFTPRYLRWLIGTAGTWFLLDIAYYGTTISSPIVLKLLNPNAGLRTNTFYTLLIFLIAAVPGYILAAFTIDRLGRKWIQCVGFGMMALAYLVLAFVPSLSSIIVPFLIIYGISYFFRESAGPTSQPSSIRPRSSQ